MSDRIYAPFTEEQVLGLNAFQASERWHPFTCGRRGDTPHKVLWGDLGTLVATRDGWVCVSCDYTQNWAHAFMANGAPRA